MGRRLRHDRMGFGEHHTSVGDHIEHVEVVGRHDDGLAAPAKLRDQLDEPYRAFTTLRIAREALNQTGIMAAPNTTSV